MNFSTDQLRAALPPDLFAKVQAQLGQPGRGPPPAKRGNKYGAVRTFALGQWWDSIKEANHAEALEMASRGGPVQWWCAKARFTLEAQTYTLDFVEQWRDEPIPRFVDVKGGQATKTKAYRQKKRAMLARYGITIREV